MASLEEIRKMFSQQPRERKGKDVKDLYKDYKRKFKKEPLSEEETITFCFPKCYELSKMENTINVAIEQYRNKERFVVFNLDRDAILLFGKHKGKTLSSIFLLDKSYLDWMISQNFEKRLLDIVQHIKLHPNWLNELGLFEIKKKV